MPKRRRTLPDLPPPRTLQEVQEEIPNPLSEGTEVIEELPIDLRKVGGRVHFGRDGASQLGPNPLPKMV